MTKTGTVLRATPEGYALPCGCTIHLWDGLPEITLDHDWTTGRKVYVGVLEPHLHPRDDCPIHGSADGEINPVLMARIFEHVRLAEELKIMTGNGSAAGLLAMDAQRLLAALARSQARVAELEAQVARQGIGADKP